MVVGQIKHCSVTFALEIPASAPVKAEWAVQGRCPLPPVSPVVLLAAAGAGLRAEAQPVPSSSSPSAYTDCPKLPYRIPVGNLIAFS